MPRKLTAVVCALAVVSAPAFAILGIGDIVYDPSNYALALQRLIQLEQQYAQLVQTYQMISNQYNQMLWMAKLVPVNMAARYRAMAHRLTIAVSGGSDYHADESHGAPHPGSVSLPRDDFDRLVRLKPGTTA